MATEESRILDIEGAIMGGWQRDGGVHLYFHSIFPTRTKGKVDANDGKHISQLEYEIYFEDGIPYLKTTDKVIDQTKVYEIMSITSQKELKLKNKQGDIFHFHP